MADAQPIARPGRLQWIDVARGLAIVAMVAYHALWFADDYRLVDLDMSGLALRAFQKSIAGTFFVLVGVSLVLASTPRLRASKYLRRLGEIVACAAVVTTTSLVMDPDRLVTFGILHSIAVCSVLGLAFRGLGYANLVLGGLAVAVGVTVHLEAFAHPVLHWTGLSPHVPTTFDFQPLFPWFGVVLLGMALGHHIVRGGLRGDIDGGDALAWMGRYSLWLYMAHVPILVGVMELLAHVFR